ncbi:hypothetical protein LTR86_011124 [Recurvomyces mirabilis]|nr:hypothetical protein LTR86_011124 [Recurvomyces mirabilis]
MSEITIRRSRTTRGDGELLIQMFDSQLPWLQSIGSGDQWGSSFIRDDPAKKAKYHAKVHQSEVSEQQQWSPQWTGVYIAERKQALSNPKDREAEVVPVAALILEAKSADYVRPVLLEQDEKDPFLYLAYLLTDRTAIDLGKGAGAALILHAKVEARRLGLSRICMDCWSGNGGKLVQYYERQGFKSLGSFGLNKLDDWPGEVLEMRI